MTTDARVLLLCGPSGVGKSTVGYEIFRQLVVEGVKSAYLDLDQVGLCRPAPIDDPDNVGMSAQNLASVWPNFSSRGARCLVTSGIVHTHQQIHSYTAAVPDSSFTVCRLRAARDTLRERILLRGGGGGPPLPGDELRYQSTEALIRAAEHSADEADAMDAVGLGDFCVDTDLLALAEVVRLVRARANL